jgi:Fe-S cluster biosynthesis and repair protein YggX
MAKNVNCAKLGQELPAIDDQTPEGQRALKMALLLGGPEMQQRVRDNVSADAWSQWTDHMRMVINEYRLDPTSDEANPILAKHMEQFLFGDGKPVSGYTPPKS